MRVSYLDYLSGNPSTSGDRVTREFASQSEYEVWLNSVKASEWDLFCQGQGDGKIDYLGIQVEG
jgi:hypothetical protein